MYYKRCSLGFRPSEVNHWNLVADPGHHNYKECLVSLVYSWEQDNGCYPPWQWLKPGKHLTPLDANMDDSIAVHAAGKKLDRVAAYRQVQGYSQQLHEITRGQLGIDNFDVPENVHVRPVEANETRIVEVGEQDIAYIVDKDTQRRLQVLPDDYTTALLLVLMLDHGTIGAAGVAYGMFMMCKLLYPKFDKIHRLIRDLKNAQKHCCKSVFLKTKLWTSYLFGLNNRPFGSGGNATLKRRMLELFQACETVGSGIFKKYLPRTAKAWNMPYDTAEEQQQVFNRVLEMRSFVHKLSQPKMQNWFAWNKCAYEQLPEFHPTKMIFESQLEGEPDPDDCGDFDIGGKVGSDPVRQLKAMLKNGGGIRLAYKLMKEALLEHARILYVAEQPSWDWYTNEVENTKTPQDAFAYSLHMADGGWAQEQHIARTTEIMLYDTEQLKYMEVPMGRSPCATKVHMLQWHIVKYRAWALSKHDCPPECYAPIGSTDLDKAQRSCESMKTHHRNVLMLEQRVHEVPAAEQLHKDMAPIVKSVPIRLLLEFFARDKYSRTSRAGRALLKGMLWTMCDNKCVEDVHHKLRIGAKQAANRRMSKTRIQDTIVSSEVFEGRGVRHKARVNRSTFVRCFRSIKARSFGSKHNASRHKLPKPWSKIMSPVKTWPSLTEDAINKSTAAWVWLHNYMQMRTQNPDLQISSALWTKFVLPYFVLLHEAVAWASLGNAVWASLGIRLSVEVVGGTSCYLFPRHESIEWFHVTEPSDWSVGLVEATRNSSKGIVLEAIGEAIPLLQHTLQTNSKALGIADLTRCAEYFQVVLSTNPNELLQSIAEHLKPGDTDFANLLKNNFGASEEKGDALLKDPLVEAVFEDLDPEDKTEFPEVGEAIKARKIKRRTR